MNICKHGQLRRQCDLCEKDDRIAELERQVEEMQAQLDEVDRKLVESALRLQFEQHRTLVQSGDRRSAIVRNTREEIVTEADITPLSSRVHLPDHLG